jgi:hypothetical protein
MEDRGLSDEQLGRMLQVMTTEHSALQAGRSATIFETGGRTAVFLGTVSSALVALAFVGQISGLGTAFFAFALVLLPTLFFLGLVTFERALELGIEDYIYAVGVSRIRHFYVEAVPQSERYFVGPTRRLREHHGTHRLRRTGGAYVVAIVPDCARRHSRGKRRHLGLVRGPARGSGRGRVVRPGSRCGHRGVPGKRALAAAPSSREVAPNRATLARALSRGALSLAELRRITLPRTWVNSVGLPQSVEGK